MKKTANILFIAFWGILFSICTSCTSIGSADDAAHKCVAADVCGNCCDVNNFLLSDYDDGHAEMLAADVSQLGSIAVNLRIMVKFTARQIYKTSVFWAKHAVRMIADYMQHKSFITEYLNSNKFRIGMTGSHISYLYQLCRIVI